MLTDADPLVPEVLRAAWLTTNIAIENHTRGRSGEVDLAEAWTWASVPFVLMAGSVVELVPPDRLPIAQAMSLWQVASNPAAQVVADWWSAWQTSQTPLPVALRDLARLMS